MADRKALLTVLVVDDEALLRWSIAEFLRRGGHTVLEATSTATARDAIEQRPASIDVVLLDHRLPDSNDLRLLEEVRRRLPQSAVVLMTASGSPEMVQEALDRGATMATRASDARPRFGPGRKDTGPDASPVCSSAARAVQPAGVWSHVAAW